MLFFLIYFENAGMCRQFCSVPQLEQVHGFITNFPVNVAHLGPNFCLLSTHVAPDGWSSGILCMHLVTGKSCWILQSAVQYARI